MLPKTPVLTIIAQCTAQTFTAITSLFSSTHMVWTRCWESRFNYVRLISRWLRWFIDVAVPQNDSTLSPRSTRPPEYLDYCLRTLWEDILSKAYERTTTYPDEFQLLPTQQDVQQNWKLSFKWYFIFRHKIHRPAQPWRRHTFNIPTISFIEPPQKLSVRLTPVSCRVIANA